MADEKELDEILGTNGSISAHSVRNRALEDLERETARRKKTEEIARFRFNKTPIEFYDQLSKYVIGQRDALMQVSTLVAYHYRTLSEYGEVEKSNMLLIGPTGCGKTYVIEKVSQFIGTPLIITDATKYTAAGYVGDDVENMVRDLVVKAEGDLNIASRGIVYIDEVDKITTNNIIGRDVGGRDVQSGLLKIIERGDVKVLSRGGERLLNTKNILFIFGGAFSEIYDKLKTYPRFGFVNSARDKEQNDGEALCTTDQCELLEALKNYGIIPEFLGRISLVARFRQLDKDDLIKILKESGDSIINDCKRKLRAYGIESEFTADSYDTIAELASQRKMGARALKSVLDERLLQSKFYLPGSGIKKITISGETIRNPEQELKVLLESKIKSPGGKNG